MKSITKLLRTTGLVLGHLVLQLAVTCATLYSRHVDWVLTESGHSLLPMEALEGYLYYYGVFNLLVTACSILTISLVVGAIALSRKNILDSHVVVIGSVLLSTIVAPAVTQVSPGGFQPMFALLNWIACSIIIVAIYIGLGRRGRNT